MKETEMHCRDGSFGIIFCVEGSEQKLLMGKRSDDGLWEYLGGGFDAKDFTAKTALIREVYEEAHLRLNGKNKITLFAVLTQKLPQFGGGEKGHAFCFMSRVDTDLLSRKLKPSNEHTEIRWHSISDILEGGEKLYKTASLRMTLRFLMYLENPETQVGVLAEKVTFNGYEF